MLQNEAKLKRAILHSDEHVATAAVRYFAESFSPDPTLMPTVINAVETFGRFGAFRLLRAAERLAQTPDTVEWLVRELYREFDLDELELDNYRFAITLLLQHADWSLVTPQRDRIVEATNFPQQFRAEFEERLEMHTWGAERLWE